MKIHHYFFKQLIGASFSISVFWMIMLVLSEFNLYAFHEDVPNLWIWLLFYGYGVLSAFLIDFMGKFIPRFTIIKQLMMYILFGYLIFFIALRTEVIFIMIAGTVGAFFSLLFWLGKEYLKPTRWYSSLVFVIPFICLLIIPFDFTSKVGWNETKDHASLTVEYDYFNGRHPVSIYGEKGEKIYFKVEHHATTFDSYGMSIAEKAPVAELENDGVFSMVFEEKSVKHIYVETLKGHEGGFQVTWWKEN